MARSAPSSLKAKRGQLSEAQIAVNDFHTGCLAYLADPFSDTGALSRFDALAVSKNLIDVFFLLVLLQFKRSKQHLSRSPRRRAREPNEAKTPD
jgi:hypothetical protein